MIEAWAAMTQTEQIAVSSFLFGIFMWFVQWLWTWLPIAGPQPDWATWKKRLWSVLLAVLPGVIVAIKTGQWQAALLTAVVAWAGSQTAYSATKTNPPVVAGGQSPNFLEEL
jgi:hypothetical protein